MSVLTRRVEKLECACADGDENWELILLNESDPDPVVDDGRNVIIVRSVKPRVEECRRLENVLSVHHPTSVATRRVLSAI